MDSVDMPFVHTTLHVADLERSVAFYRRLGLPVARRLGDCIAFLGEGETLLELIGDGNGPVDYPGISIGFTSPDAAALARELDENFVGPVTPGPGVEFYFVKDPDGFSVQILQG